MPTRRRPVSTCVALLRGINVGGKNIITMEALRAGGVLAEDRPLSRA